METTAGDMPARWVIHAATMELGGPTSAEIIEAATRSTLAARRAARRAGRWRWSRSAPASGGFPLEEAARADGRARSREHRGGSLERVVFAVHGDEAERAFAAAAGS